jgi:hypothetical protein
MSQQEFVPESQSQAHDPLKEDEVYYPRAPYSWSGKLDKEATPRDVPPSSYGEPKVQQGYPAQTNAGQNDAARGGQGGGGANSNNAQAWQRQGGSSGDAGGYQRGYGPYRSYNSKYNSYNASRGTSGGPGQGVPPWARPQQHRRAPFRFGFILLILVAIALIQGLLANGGGFVGVTGDIFGAIIGLLVLVLIVPLIILVVFSGLLMRMFRSGGLYRRRRRWRGHQWPRGPYWW